MATSSQYGYDIAKAGWLYRQSSVLHRWKKNWFVLDRQGDLRYFESPDVPRAEERIVVRATVLSIKTGPDCRKADPPEGMTYAKASFLELCMREKESLLLCAESLDDMRAWQIALEEARTIHAPAGQVMAPGGISTTTIVAPPGYVHTGSPYMSYGYPGHVISPGPMGSTTQIIRSPAGTTTVVQPTQQIVYVDDGPYHYRRRCYRGGIYPMPLFFW